MTAATTPTSLPPASAAAWTTDEPFALGAHLITPRCGYTHHGIYVGRGRVVHYAGWSRALLTRRPVEEVSLTEFAGDCGVAVQPDSAIAFAPAEVVARARSRLGEDCYRLTTNNCEHFCHWARSGSNSSAQVDRLLGWTGAARALLARTRGALALRIRPIARPALRRAAA
jgi:hypothetical protein